MKNFATIVRDYVSARNRLIYYQNLSRDCIKSLATLPNNSKEVGLIKDKWNHFKEEFPGIYVPSETFYPVLLQNYINEKITYAEYKEKAEKWGERIKTEELFFKRYVEEAKNEMLKAYNNFHDVNNTNPEMKEVFAFLEENFDKVMLLLSAEFEI